MKRLLPDRLSARLLLSSGLQLLLVGTALGLLGYATGLREGLERVALERQQNQLTSLSTALSMRLRAPQTINRENMLAIRQGMLRLDDFNQLGLRFWRQMQLYPVGYINWGSSAGSFLGVERLENGRLVLNEDSAQPLGRGRLGVYALGPHGARGPLLEVQEGMTTFHQEAWYTDTVKAGRATWSSIYQWEDKPEVVAISYNEPVRDGRGTILGVIGVDFVLSQLSSWLQQLWTHQQGVALVVEPSGLIVASSNPELALVHAGGTRQRMRIDQLAGDGADAKVNPRSILEALLFVGQPGARGLRPHQAAIARSNGQGLSRVSLSGQTYHLEARPWGRAEGLNWLLITALSQDAALVRSQQQSTLALLLGLLALAAPDQPFTADLPAGAAVELAGMAAAFADLVWRLQHKDAAALQLLRAKLRTSLEASAVAHEIKLPLSQILLSSRLLLEGADADAALGAATRAELSAIAAAADQVVTTIEKMRTLLRNVQTNHSRLNLAHVANSALLYIRPALNRAGVQIERMGLGQPCLIDGDSTQLQIALVNLLRNSLEALEQQPPVRRLRVSLEQHSDQAFLQIEDNGPGFPALPDLLEPLQTSRREGSGLGLFVVTTTLENHKGSIELGRSSLGGAAVTLRLPLAAADGLPSSG
ncbi:MAG: GHKL domain-containing protein [Synechococcaceae bacterium WBB_10_009]|nr:GHKL domain-containing protein [Synechococcaceae bacterium WBB_10_009]